MIVTLEEMKQYLRVDFPDDDSLIEYLLSSAEKICMDIMRTDDANALQSEPNAKTGVLYTVAYLYEHREDADYHALMITLRALLFGSRREGF
ncbi:head-tail connector protein [Agathobaculum sp. NTUH-O15-33]|uniref:head-tail connector protein n=1 Tax=Agathobaculum sp. NTUH-O15-33 TaxID=3079302 RepID=UPI002958B63A|nr:head-tail connector protein [Agathobaculum sp. NTUH-O15-33]WNX86034.1 head-tail connector protein [Agathobaculum sp. NTUH-O15-33]